MARLNARVLPSGEKACVKSSAFPVVATGARLPVATSCTNRRPCPCQNSMYEKRRPSCAQRGGEQHAPLRRLVGIIDVDLQEETVKLRLGERVGAFLLQRILTVSSCRS